jgi:hypothetical protein
VPEFKFLCKEVPDYGSCEPKHAALCDLTLKANSHIPYSSHAVTLRVQIAFSPFDLHSATVFYSYLSYHDHAVLKAISQGHGTGRHWRGMGMAWAWYGNDYGMDMAWHGHGMAFVN